MRADVQLVLFQQPRLPRLKSAQLRFIRDRLGGIAQRQFVRNAARYAENQRRRNLTTRPIETQVTLADILGEA